MAEILFRSKLSTMLFSGLAPISSKLPGRLVHANVMGCALFAATCGSSAATTMTVGRVTYAELVSRGYDKSLVLGSLAGPGTLGLLIPPSTIMIVYGILTETSILKLFISGFVPGLILTAGLSGYVAAASFVRPGLVPQENHKYSLAESARSLLKVAPVLMLIAMVMGAMYFGVASPSETATIGVLGALIISFLQRTLTLNAVIQSLKATARTTSILGMIIAAAVFLSTAFGFLGIPQTVARTLSPLAESPVLLIMILLVFYIVLGCFLEGISIIVMTIPVVLPLVIQAGFDKLWFGIFVVIVVEMAQITPPLGFNIFVLQGLTREPAGVIVRAVIPFFLVLCTFVLLMIIFPGVATVGA